MGTKGPVWGETAALNPPKTPQTPMLRDLEAGEGRGGPCGTNLLETHLSNPKYPKVKRVRALGKSGGGEEEEEEEEEAFSVVRVFSRRKTCNEGSRGHRGHLQTPQPLWWDARLLSALPSHKTGSFLVPKGNNKRGKLLRSMQTLP